MGFHHVALATPNIEATHRFYTEAMGFDLVKAVVAPTPEGGWAKHVFYDIGDGSLIAFWDLHVPAIPKVEGAISRGLGLPEWVNHLAFTASDRDALDVAQARWASFGYDIFEIDHDFCISAYAVDPNGILVEWCMDTRPFTQAERDHANSVILSTEATEFGDEPKVSFHPGNPSLRPQWATPDTVTTS